uniref:Activin_recp domain-containing protein n=1 Tax=Panagrellus redivivus TaxID=6233 RepID=A0A7E4W8A4_PANRE
MLLTIRAAQALHAKGPVASPNRQTSWQNQCTLADWERKAQCCDSDQCPEIPGKRLISTAAIVKKDSANKCDDMEDCEVR